MAVNDTNLTAWFRDAATRHPKILHVETVPGKRFFEMEWDEMVQNGKQLANDKWYLILEDYKEQFFDNGGEYITITPVLSFLVVRSTPLGNSEKKMETYVEAREIAKSIVQKLHADSIACRNNTDADVPPGVVPPVNVELGTLTFQRVQPPMFAHSAGVYCTVRVRTNEEEDFGSSDVDWVPLP
jgi:hypothetical protein